MRWLIGAAVQTEAQSNSARLTLTQGRYGRGRDKGRAPDLTIADFSPDGEWIAHQTTETEPNPHRNAGQPFWSRTGDRIVRQCRPTENYVIAVATGPQVVFGRPVVMPRIGHFRLNPNVHPRNIDSLPDGRLIGIGPAGQSAVGAEPAPQITVIVNW